MPVVTESILSLSLPFIIEKDICVFPNPCKNHIVYIDPGQISDDLKKLEVWDLNGRLLLEKKLKNPSTPIELKIPINLHGVCLVSLIGVKYKYKTYKVYVNDF